MFLEKIHMFEMLSYFIFGKYCGIILIELYGKKIQIAWRIIIQGGDYYEQAEKER